MIKEHAMTRILVYVAIGMRVCKTCNVSSVMHVLHMVHDLMLQHDTGEKYEWGWLVVTQKERLNYIRPRRSE